MLLILFVYIIIRTESC